MGSLVNGGAQGGWVRGDNPAVITTTIWRQH